MDPFNKIPFLRNKLFVFVRFEMYNFNAKHVHQKGKFQQLKS